MFRITRSNALLVRQNRGAAVLETALCLPIIVYLIFFILEIIRISILQISLDSIAVKVAFEYGGSKNNSEFINITKATLPDLLQNEKICIQVKTEDIENFGQYPEWIGDGATVISGIAPTSGTMFEVTVSCSYHFTNSVAAALFMTKRTKNDNFVIWSRAVSICN